MNNNGKCFCEFQIYGLAARMIIKLIKIANL